MRCSNACLLIVYKNGTVPMSINNKAIASGNQEYYSEEFRATLEKHIPYLMNGRVSTLHIESRLDVRFRNDFDGLLQSLGVPAEHWWICKRLNGFHRSDEYKGGLPVAIVPDATTMTNLMTTFLSMK